MDQCRCSMWLNVGYCTKISRAWTLQTDSLWSAAHYMCAFFPSTTEQEPLLTFWDAKKQHKKAPQSIVGDVGFWYHRYWGKQALSLSVVEYYKKYILVPLVGVKKYSVLPYCPLLLTGTFIQFKPSLERKHEGKRWNLRYFSTSLVSSGSVWSTVRDRSFCRYFNAFSGSDWAFSSNLENDKTNKNQQQQHGKCWALTHSFDCYCRSVH